MEIELKYLLGDEKKANEIFADEFVSQIKDDKAEERINMDAVYYDTEDRSLTDQKIAFRVRKEDEQYIATLKWDGTSDNGMHKRQEINVPVSDKKFAVTPDATIFSQSEMSEVLEAIIGSRKLIPLMEVEFTRRLIRLDTGKSISELSIDIGEIKANDKIIPISELEIELFSGNEDDIVEIGNKIAQKYDLHPENKSKFERGYELLV